MNAAFWKFWQKPAAKRRDEGQRLSHQGWRRILYYGPYQEAIEYFQRALAIAREIGDRGREGGCLYGLGRACHALGRYQEAIEYYKQALAIAREIGDRHTELFCLTYLGRAYFYFEDYERASACTLRAEETSLAISSPWAKEVAKDLALLRRKLGQKPFQKLEARVGHRMDEIIGGLLSGERGEGKG